MVNREAPLAEYGGIRLLQQYRFDSICTDVCTISHQSVQMPISLLLYVYVLLLYACVPISGTVLK